ncbi:asparagine synthase (glutamine-hydrolyzing) [Denitrobaculum tricleocarpae]|uniref:asparagine synthase (glutamine-hydrolyzing) n=1 Tax=Denitrobaculum tricleocarpae TaxID=2591009 RepID=A0A545TB50_9PROT|nr:asparagine synthase (glutamine-hydrolyzing) [Denitrobaculum tricleocarpae]TQV74445.1 asparagine synthase (glutamine-hydrolyzing) [Denitrobaculum tricleocarpae]
MCGIFGHTGLQNEKIENSHSALHTLTHRGPDSWHFETKDGLYLGHRRLSILDLSPNGRQPMQADGVYLTVNGEIYNYRALRQELIENHQADFVSQSDSEVLLHGYIHWGIERLLDRVDGMFALSLFDSRIRKVILARDHAGIKPLYYGLREGGLSWSSELKALERFYGTSNLVIDKTAIYDFMTYLYVPCPKTLYRDIFKLEPGYFLTYDLGTQELEKTRYWSLAGLEPVGLDAANYETVIRAAIHGAVEEQLVSDVPVGFFLSGGIDSSIVCYEASRCIEQLSSFTIGNADESVDEAPYARMVAQQIGADHHSKVFSSKIADKNFPLMRSFYDEPFGDVSALPTNEVCKLARERVTVVLTGDGGDELFGGYTHYRDAERIFDPVASTKAWVRPIVVALKNHAPLRLIAKKAQRYESKTLDDPIERWAKAKGGVLKSDRFKRTWAKKNGISRDYDDYWYYRKHDDPGLSPKTRAQSLDFHTYLHDSVLTKVDRASMAVGLETRVPFLSKKSIATAWSLPEDLRYRDGELKGVLKHLYTEALPAEVLYRRKQGFAVGPIEKTARLYDRTKNVPRQILKQLFPEVFGA